MENPVTLYLVRHGETEWNIQEILQGQLDSPLTEKGLHQAHVIAQQFEHVEFDAIYSSDIGRAKTTAEIIAQYHHLEVKTSNLIRERYFGHFQGMKKLEADTQLKIKHDEARELTREARMSFRLADDIETEQEMISRLFRFFQKIHPLYPGKRVLTVCHGALMRVFLVYLDFARHGQLGFHSIDNLGYIVINTDGHEVDLLEARGVHLEI